MIDWLFLSDSIYFLLQLLITILILAVSKFTPINAIFVQMFIVSHKSQITCL